MKSGVVTFGVVTFIGVSFGVVIRCDTVHYRKLAMLAPVSSCADSVIAEYS